VVIELKLPAKGTLRPNNEHDPLPYYYRPVIGALYRRRLRMGLDLIPAGGRSVLEVGVGSGILVPTLSERFPVYTGTDLELVPGLERLAARGCAANFLEADLLDERALPAEAYDVVVCFSVLEHIPDPLGAARGLARVLRRGGTLVAGYPMVNLFMVGAFAAIGYRQEGHVSTPSMISRALASVLEPVARTALPPGAPVPLALYQCTSWKKT
jgi:SAM-dependent methyltransferase